MEPLRRTLEVTADPTLLVFTILIAILRFFLSLLLILVGILCIILLLLLVLTVLLLRTWALTQVRPNSFCRNRLENKGGSLR